MTRLLTIALLLLPLPASAVCLQDTSGIRLVLSATPTETGWLLAGSATIPLSQPEPVPAFGAAIVRADGVVVSVTVPAVQRTGLFVYWDSINTTALLDPETWAGPGVLLTRTGMTIQSSPWQPFQPTYWQRC